MIALENLSPKQGLERVPDFVAKQILEICVLLKQEDELPPYFNPDFSQAVFQAANRLGEVRLLLVASAIEQ